ncbi:DUF6364 family protein [Capnocytophaga leadbetteri]|jgi:hypothetical protein|uniref:DUF6364 family protein n=1 Tax=Capnocytophaga leadbetteri TaxID=327575 RepID=UPI0028D33748|nr:DUF6364 family protein [Capnocytophaga leadbetteri]
MNTMTIDPIVWEKAQRYAQENDLNLANYIENQLKNLYIQDEEWAERMKHTDIDALLDGISGVLPEMTDEEVREECANYIEEKYFALG